MKIKKNDTVKILSGAHKGKTGKVVEVLPRTNQVKIEGIGLRKRHVKPTQLNPRGGTKDIHTALPASVVALIVDQKGTTSRIGYQIKKDNTKVRVARSLKNKEIA